MRLAAERKVWDKSVRQRRNAQSTIFELSPGGKQLEISPPCTVIAGLNGAGKSRTLRLLSESFGEKALLIQLHELCEHARTSLRTRVDIEAMEEETGPIELDDETLQHISRIIGRDYEYVEWYSLEYEPNEAYRESFRWPGDQILVPHFRVKYRNVEYSSLDMGLGEFSVHLLFWVLAHYRDTKEIFVLLDEPDAYLPPLTAERLLARLLEVARPKQWNLVIATHSESLIEIACENDSFVLLRSGETGIEAYDSAKHGVDIAAELISPRPLRSFMFCEDESAAALTRAILETERGWLLASTSVIWKDGHGYLRKLAEYLPRYKGMETSFTFVFDGDQRGLLVQPNHPESTWPSLCLPTSLDPDTLFRDLASDVPAMAAALNQPELKVHAALDALQGTDEHDWVNGICDRLGARTTVLNALAQLWVANNRADSDKFLQDLRTLIDKGNNASVTH